MYTRTSQLHDSVTPSRIRHWFAQCWSERLHLECRSGLPYPTIPSTSPSVSLPRLAPTLPPMGSTKLCYWVVDQRRHWVVDQVRHLLRRTQYRAQEALVSPLYRSIWRPSKRKSPTVVPLVSPLGHRDRLVRPKCWTGTGTDESIDVPRRCCRPFHRRVRRDERQAGKKPTMIILESSWRDRDTGNIQNRSGVFALKPWNNACLNGDDRPRRAYRAVQQGPANILSYPHD
jgi:hypothetical protein